MKTNTRFWSSPLVLGLVFAILALTGCSGDDGAPGAPGKDVDPATVDNLQSQIDALTLGSGESCAICHSDAGGIVLSGAGHQAAYDELYQDQVVRVTNLAYDGTGGNNTVTFEMLKNGQPLDCTTVEQNDPGLPPDALSIQFAAYDTATREFSDGAGSTFWVSIKGTLTYDAGTNVCTSTAAQTALGDLSGLDGEIVVFGRDETLTEDSARHMYNAKYPFATMMRLGTVDYVSQANASACEGCHTRPFLKHAYIYGEVNDGTNNDGNDFYVCKSCHLDQRNGGHLDWQILKDDPARYAEIVAGSPLTPAEEAKYAYKTRLMNDVHMSHNMELPYPQEMFNCATCHEGKLDPLAGGVLAIENFTAETCKSCHSVDGLITKMQTSRAGNPITLHDSTVIPALEAGTWTGDCTGACHGSAAPSLANIHNGYNPEIYADAAGTKYADEVTVSIDDASVAANVLTIQFSADAGALAASVDVADIVPTVMIGLYGYNTKDFIVAAHGRDADNNRLLEYPVDGVTVNPRFTTVTAAGGAWEVTADLSMWADMIADGTIKRAEIAVLPQWKDANGDTVGLNAPSKTFDLGGGAFVSSDDIVEAASCNTCHDQLATTFHSGNRGGNVKVCRLCHVKSSGGSHLEMQSRSIDSYVHAIHSFQAFDPGDIDFTDPVAALEYEHHISSRFPRFGTDCESCHITGTYGVPDQSKSLPALLSGSDTIATWDRNIGMIPSVVTGPAANACGACHRSEFINEDDAGTLAAFNAHTAQFGYRVENDPDSTAWDKVVAAIMSMF
jgi:OmcA/MtrC family decaheme c-type cytochrome